MNILPAAHPTGNKEGEGALSNHPAVVAFGQLVAASAIGNHRAGKAAIKTLREHGYSVVLIGKAGGR